MGDRNWFQKKWGLPEVPADVLLKKIEELEDRVVKLEEENIENTNLIYELMNSLEAIDNRIDIIMCEPYNLPTNAKKLR
tara:strand:+ start:245 stop:481 length:237 start_codon:yes stop_codon:yes gene_type:complete